jgi:signal transduction histidine kinase
VGLLRAAATNSQPVAARDLLRAVADRFADRTGVRCTLPGEGTPQPLDAARQETLRFALQATLTNAYRHGGARQVTAVLSWQAD